MKTSQLMLATRLEEVRARLRVADAERVGAMQYHDLMARECSALQEELDDLEESLAALQANEAAARAVADMLEQDRQEQRMVLPYLRLPLVDEHGPVVTVGPFPASPTAVNL